MALMSTIGQSDFRITFAVNLSNKNSKFKLIELKLTASRLSIVDKLV